MANIQKIHLKMKRGEVVTPGVTVKGDTIQFCITLYDTEECLLHIYKYGTDEKLTSITIDKNYKIGDIFNIVIENWPYQSFEYMYEVDKKQVLDPYARMVVGRSQFGETLSRREKERVRAAVTTYQFTWNDDPKLKIPFDDMILYRLHVRGFTRMTQQKEKGTFRALQDKIPYLVELGINAVELLPIYEFEEVVEPNYYSSTYRSYDNYGNDYYREYLGKEGNKKKNKINYWGYTSNVNYYAVKSSYCFTDLPQLELKECIKAMHQAGIEVIMEMFFTTAIVQTDLVACLKYWVDEYHIDGFHLIGDNIPSFYIATDPYFADTKILFSGWDIPAIYHERTPRYKNLAEYNDNFQNDIRKYLKGDENLIGAVGMQFKSNPFKCGKINYITNTNGFTLMDLYSYDIKHNERNGEDGRDGTDYNFSWNCGIEGKTKKKKILEIRKKQIRNALVLLLLSQGSPMILAGDEFGNSQEGNNNAYCQDNEVSWLNWELVHSNRELLEYVKTLIFIRKNHPILHMQEEFRMMDYISCGYPDLSFHGEKVWYPDYSIYNRTLGILLCGKYKRINHIKEDDFFYFMFNMHWEKHTFDIPKLPEEKVWKKLLDTNNEKIDLENRILLPKDKVQMEVKPRTIVVLQSISGSRKDILC